MREVRMGVKAIELVVTIALKHSKCQVKPRTYSTHSYRLTLTLTDSPSLPHSLTPSLSLSPTHILSLSHTLVLSHTLSLSRSPLGSQNKP